MKTQGRRKRKPWKSHPKTFQKAAWKTTPKKHQNLNQKWLQNRFLFRIVFHDLLHRGECLAGSRFLNAFMKNAFSSPGPCFSSLFGPSLSTLISMKFILGALGVPWASPGRQDSSGRPLDIFMDALGTPERARGSRNLLSCM